MDQRRAAGALLALAVCIGSAAAAPTASNQTGLDLYDSSTEGCYYNFQHYGEGDRIMTNEPCLNCTCHNRMLMCYLRVCPFTKPIGQDCSVEKRADQCCPIVTCPDVPVDLLTSTTTSPAEYGATGLGKLDKYGCSIHGKYFPEGSKVPPTPNKPCEHCYCIRNMTTCVMQECTLHVDGCTPIYHKDVCCPVRYSCDHPEDETLLLDDMTTTVRPTPGFLLTTTTLSPVTQMSQDCVHDDQIFSDGALIKTEKACEHCYCMKGDIVCVVQECGTPMENEGKNCTSQPPREGQCCPDTYICEGDEVTTEPPSELTTEQQLKEDLTTMKPPRRVSVEGSGYRNEDEPVYTEIPSLETDAEGSGYEQSTEPTIDIITPEKEILEISTEPIDESLHFGTTTLRTPTLEEIEKTTEPDKSLNTVPSDEEGYEPSLIEKTTPPVEAIATETTITSGYKQDEDEEKLTVADVTTTPAVTSMIGEVSSTTESPFRKEDDIGEPTETYAHSKDEATTEAADFEDKTTLAEDYATVSQTKAPFMEELEKQTTLSAQLTQKDIDQSFDSKPTTESILELSSSAATEPYDSIETTTDYAKPSKAETGATVADEKIDVSETTSSDENEVEDILTTLRPGRIPGEGDCLLNDITYRNNSEVPSSNVCHTSCRCVSSIVKCDPIICSPPPEYMDNCQPTYDPPGSCCPTYVCHTGETIPPQPHSQMSGTESPVPSPAIECDGDQCEVKPAVDRCESAECSDQSQSPTPEQPIEKCEDGKCLSPIPQCADGDCQATPVEEPVIVPVKDVPLCENEEDCKRIKPEAPICEGEACVNFDCSGSDCSTAPVKPPVKPVESSPVCETEGDCKENKPEAPACEGEGCVNVNVDCSGSDCHVDAIKPPVESSPVCENEEDCKKIEPDFTPCDGEECTNGNVGCVGSDCSADTSKPSAAPDHEQKTDETVEPCTETSCRRKEPGEVQSPLPSDCAGSECVQPMPATEDNKNDLGTESPISDAQPIDVTTTKQDVQTETPESHLSEKTTPKQDEESSGVTSEAPESAEDKTHETTPSLEAFTELDRVATTEASMIVGDDKTITKVPEISPTEETKIGDTDVSGESSTDTPDIEMYTKEQEPSVTQLPETTTKTILGESVQTEISDDKHTSEPQESSTKATLPEESETKLPGQHVTGMTDDELSITTTQRDLVEKETEPSTSQESDKDVTISVEPIPSESPAIEDSSRLPEPTTQKTAVSEPGATESAFLVPVTTESIAHESEITETGEVIDTTAKTHEVPVISDTEVTTELTIDSFETTTEDKQVYQPDHTQSPSYNQVEEETSAVDRITEKMPEDVSDHITEAPAMYDTKEPEDFTKSPEYVTVSHDLGNEETTSPQHDLVATESPVPVSDEETKSPTTALPLNVDKEDSETKVPEMIENAVTEAQPSVTQNIDEESSPTLASVSTKDEAESSEKPETVEQGQKTEPSTEHPETNEVQEPTEYLNTVKEDQQTEIPVHGITDSEQAITEKLDDLTTVRTQAEDDDKPEPTKTPTKTDENVTEEQEISTEEPSLVPIEESPGTEKIPSEPYLPVHTDTTLDSMVPQPAATTESSQADTETQTSSDVGEVETKEPGFDEKTEAPKQTDVDETKIPEVMEGPSTVISEYITQSPEVDTEVPVEKETHKGEELETESTKTPIEQAATELPDVLSTEQPKYSDVPAETEPVEGQEYSTPGIEKESGSTVETVTLGTRIQDESPADTEKQTESPEKIFTVSVVPETTAPSVVSEQEGDEQTTESHVTDSETSIGSSSIPESHVKEPEPQGTASPDTTATEPHDLATGYPDLKPSSEKPVSEMQPETQPDILQQTPTEATLQKTTQEEHKEMPESPEEAYTQTAETSTDKILSEQPEITPQVQNEITEKMQDITTETAYEVPGEPKVTVAPVQEITQETPSETDRDTSMTESSYEKPTESSQGLVTMPSSTEHVDEQMVTLVEDTVTNAPQEPSEASTKMPQEAESGEPVKYTASVPQETTPGAQDIVTDTPEKEAGTSTEAQKMEEDKEKPTEITTEEPDDTKQESSTQLPESPIDLPEQEGTVSPFVQEPTTPDLVELEEHSHKPLDEMSTISPIEQEITTKSQDTLEREPEMSTEKESALDDGIKLSTPSDEVSKVTDSAEVSDMSPLPPTEKDVQETPTEKPDKRLGEDISDEDTQTTQTSAERESSPDVEIPVQTAVESTTEKLSVSEPAQQTTVPDEYISVTSASSESSDDTRPTKTSLEDSYTKEPAEEDNTDKPVDEPTEKPSEEPVTSSEERPAEESTEKMEEKPSEGPLETPVEKPTDEPESTIKPMEASSEKPEDKPIDDLSEKPVDKPIEDPGLKHEEKPIEEPEEKPIEEPTKTGDEILVTPVEEPVGKPDEEPIIEPSEKPVEEPVSTDQKKPEDKLEEPTEEPEKTSDETPLAETPEVTPFEPSTEKTAEKPDEEPSEKPDKEPSEKPAEEPSEETSEKPAEEPSEKPDEEPSEKPTEEPSEKPDEEPSEKPTEEPSEIPAEETSEKPAGEPSEETTEIPAVEPSEKPAGEPTEETSETPAEETTDKPAEEPAEKPAGEPLEETSETPAEVPTEKPAEEPSEKPAEEPSEKPAEDPSEKPAEDPSEKPAEEPAEEPAKEPSLTPAEEPSEKPAEEPTEKPAEEASDKPAEEPSVKPAEEPTQEVAEKPDEESTGKPSDEPVDKPTEDSKEKPEEKPSEEPPKETELKPEEKPSEGSEERVTEKPEFVSEETPQEKPDEKPSEVPEEPVASTPAIESPKPGFNEVQPTDEVPDDFPSSGGTSGYGTEPDYVEEDQAFGPGTCRYGGKVYVSAQQIPRDDPCDFCFCFRSDIICLQQSCPPPIHGCHEEPIQGFCCPRYECPVAMATTLNVTTTTTTTTTTLPPHFLPHAYKGAAQRRGCQIKGHTYKVGEVVRASSGPCLHCTCGGDGQMKCDPKACTPEPMLRQMIAAAVSAKRRR